MKYDRMRGDRLARLGTAAFIAITFGLAACDEVLEVEDPDRAVPGTLDDSAALDIVIAGAKGDFTDAYSGSGGDAYLSVSALMSDEFFSTGTFGTRTATDRRNQFQPADGNTSDDTYVDLHQARRALKDAADKVLEFRDASDPAFAEVKALEAFSYIALGEGWCSAIPVSDADVASATFEPGPSRTVAEMFSDAAGLFDESLAGTSTELAAVGKGRALLNAGQFAEAAAAVSGVPTDFVYFVFHSESGAQNPIFSLQDNGRYSISDEEGINGLPFRSADDPRVPWFQDPDDPDGFDPAYPLFKSLRYTGFEDPVVLASGVEARLVEAEAALEAGDISGWLDELNALRADVGALMVGMVPSYSVENPSLPPLTDPGNADARRDLMFSERAMWLYGTGHRLGDLRRLVRQYGLSHDEVYPTGSYHKGGSYGNDVAFPIDFDETNNDNFDLSACDVESAG